MALDGETAALESFAADVREGLAKPQKTIPSRWLYDVHGSELFEAITHLPEYYPTRTETAIFTTAADEMAAALGPGISLIEYGAGALVKTRILLQALKTPHAYVPIDISGGFLRESAEVLAADFPDLAIYPIVADFTQPVDVSAANLGPSHRVGFFPGSTIGNLTDSEIRDFFRSAGLALGSGAQFVLGADLKKDPAILVPAYDDAAGVTAAFNLNLLARMNRELDADFDLAQFAHEARWNERASQIEMHLVARATQSVTVAGETIKFTTGESIQTEISRKFTRDTLMALVAESGWSVQQVWQDEQSYFGVFLLRFLVPEDN